MVSSVQIQDRFFIEWIHNSINGYQDFWHDVKFDWMEVILIVDL